MGKGTCWDRVVHHDHTVWPQKLGTCPPVQPAALMYLTNLQAALRIFHPGSLPSQVVLLPCMLPFSLHSLLA